MGKYKRNTAGRFLKKIPWLIMPTDLIHRIGIAARAETIYRAITI